MYDLPCSLHQTCSPSDVTPVVYVEERGIFHQNSNGLPRGNRRLVNQGHECASKVRVSLKLPVPETAYPSLVKGAPLRGECGNASEVQILQLRPISSCWYVSMVECPVWNWAIQIQFLVPAFLIFWISHGKDTKLSTS